MQGGPVDLAAPWGAGVVPWLEMVLPNMMLLVASARPQIRALDIIWGGGPGGLPKEEQEACLPPGPGLKAAPPVAALGHPQHLLPTWHHSTHPPAVSYLLPWPGSPDSASIGERHSKWLKWLETTPIPVTLKIKLLTPNQNQECTNSIDFDLDQAWLGSHHP